MNRQVVLLVFKLVNSRDQPVRDSWRRRFELDPGDAWITAMGYQMFALVPAGLFGAVVGVLIGEVAGDGFAVKCAVSFSFLLPICSLGLGELEARYREKRAPLVVERRDLKEGRYVYADWDFPENKRLLRLSSGLGLLLAILLSPAIALTL